MKTKKTQGSKKGKKKMVISKAQHSLGSKFRKWRENKKLSQGTAAKVIGWGSSQYVSNIENGKNMPPVKMLPRISAAYGVPVGTLRTLLVNEHTKVIDQNLRKAFLNKKTQAKIQSAVKRFAATN